MNQLRIPSQLKQLMLSRGSKGKKWLQDLPLVLKRLEEKWEIELEEPFVNSYCNYVSTAKTIDGKGVVLKVSYPDPEFFREIDYLALNKKGPVAQLLKVDESIPAILLEMIHPAQTLVTIGDEEAIKVAANLMKRLWKKVELPHKFREIDDLYKDFQRLKDSAALKELFSDAVIKKTNNAYLYLQKKPGEKVLLHGDLHQYNIISDERKGWVVIDPSGIVGEREFEPATFLRNPPAFGVETYLKEKLENRIYSFSKLLNLDPKRIYLWALFQTVLSSLWAAEDKASFLDSFTNVARALAEMDESSFE